MIGLEFRGEALIRKGDKLEFIGMPTDPRRSAVLKINSGHYGQADIDALDGLPVFDEATLDPDNAAVWIVASIGKVI